MEKQNLVFANSDLMHTSCLRCGKHAMSIPFHCDEMGMKVSYTHYSYCEDCLREGLKLLKEGEPKKFCPKCGTKMEEEP